MVWAKNEQTQFLFFLLLSFRTFFHFLHMIPGPSSSYDDEGLDTTTSREQIRTERIVQRARLAFHDTYQNSPRDWYVSLHVFDQTIDSMDYVFSTHAFSFC